MKEVLALQAQLAAGEFPAPATQPTQNSVEKRVIVPARMAVPDNRFYRMALGQIGHIYGLDSVVRVIDEETALVTISNYPPGVDNPAALLTCTFVLEGVPTKGMADGQSFDINIFAKVVDTRKVDGQTRFIAWPVVKEGRAPKGRK